MKGGYKSSKDITKKKQIVGKEDKKIETREEMQEVREEKEGKKEGRKDERRKTGGKQPRKK